MHVLFYSLVCVLGCVFFLYRNRFGRCHQSKSVIIRSIFCYKNSLYLHESYNNIILSFLTSNNIFMRELFLNFSHHFDISYDPVLEGHNWCIKLMLLHGFTTLKQPSALILKKHPFNPLTLLFYFFFYQQCKNRHYF